VLELHDLSYRYPGSSTPAVDGLSLSIPRGEVFGLLGPNGAGKTTLLSMVAGLLTPSAGRIAVAGRDLSGGADVRRAIGLVPQDVALYPTLSARDNLALFGRLYGLRGALLRERIADTLERVGLLDRGDDAIQTFSGGMKRRVNIAVALLHRPELLLLDEPTVGVDPQSRRFILDQIRGIAREGGLTAIFSTHYMEEAETVCSRLAIVDHGRVVALGTPSELVASLGGGHVAIGLGEAPDAPLLAALRDLPHVAAAERREPGLLVTAARPLDVLPAVLEAVRQAGHAVRSLTYSQPNLESVFLATTGRSLRD